MDASPAAWIALAAFLAAVLLIDLLVVHRETHVIRFRQAMAVSGVYLAIGLGFGAVVWLTYGNEAAAAYYAGFIVEKSLSIDNVFVWAVIFRYFDTPAEYQRRVLFWGVFGALVMRALFILAGAALLERFDWMVFVFGTVLCASAVQLIRHRGSHGTVDLDRNPFLRLVRRVVPVSGGYRGARLVVREGGRRVATPLLLALLAVEFSDVIFAVDSVPAILAITTNTWIVFAANAFALMGLRALYFVLAELVRRFVHLDIGLALALAWVAGKMYYQGLTDEKIPASVSLAVIAVIIGSSVALSWWRTRGPAAVLPPGAAAAGVEPPQPSFGPKPPHQR
ncbi:MAG: tellurite resistance protein TerC [Gaiellales bacterium]|nr:tellurite resistance protein TerC [Gaiellales bacterium]